eukprot:gene16704-biopygen11323
MTVARAWRGHGADVARAIGNYWLGMARAWRGHFLFPLGEIKIRKKHSGIARSKNATFGWSQGGLTQKPVGDMTPPGRTNSLGLGHMLSLKYICLLDSNLLAPIGTRNQDPMGSTSDVLKCHLEL